MKPIALILLGTYATAIPPLGDARGNDVVVAPSVFVAIGLGTKSTFGVGFDLRASYVSGDAWSCPSKTMTGVGAYAQVHWFLVSGWRFSGGIHACTETGTSGSLDFELGWSYTASIFGSSSHGVQTGVLISDLPLEGSVRWNVADGDERALLDLQLGVGIRVPGLFGGTLCAF